MLLFTQRKQTRLIREARLLAVQLVSSRQKDSSFSDTFISALKAIGCLKRKAFLTGFSEDFLNDNEKGFFTNQQLWDEQSFWFQLCFDHLAVFCCSLSAEQNSLVIKH